MRTTIAARVVKAVADAALKIGAEAIGIEAEEGKTVLSAATGGTELTCETTAKPALIGEAAVKTGTLAAFAQSLPARSGKKHPRIAVRAWRSRKGNQVKVGEQGRPAAGTVKVRGLRMPARSGIETEETCGLQIDAGDLAGAMEPMLRIAASGDPKADRLPEQPKPAVEFLTHDGGLAVVAYDTRQCAMMKPRIDYRTSLTAPEPGRAASVPRQPGAAALALAKAVSGWPGGGNVLVTDGRIELETSDPDDPDERATLTVRWRRRPPKGGANRKTPGGSAIERYGSTWTLPDTPSARTPLRTFAAIAWRQDARWIKIAVGPDGMEWILDDADGGDVYSYPSRTPGRENDGAGRRAALFDRRLLAGAAEFIRSAVRRRGHEPDDADVAVRLVPTGPNADIAMIEAAGLEGLFWIGLMPMRR